MQAQFDAVKRVLVYAPAHKPGAGVKSCHLLAGFASMDTMLALGGSQVANDTAGPHVGCDPRRERYSGG